MSAREGQCGALNCRSFNAACLGKTPYLLSSTGAADHTIESGAAAAAHKLPDDTNNQNPD